MPIAAILTATLAMIALAGLVSYGAGYHSGYHEGVVRSDPDRIKEFSGRNR